MAKKFITKSAEELHYIIELKDGSTVEESLVANNVLAKVKRHANTLYPGEVKKLHIGAIQDVTLKMDEDFFYQNAVKEYKEDK